MTLGKIVIKENKVYFEPDGLEKPVNPGIDGSFSEDINYIKNVEKYIASKQLVEVNNAYFDVPKHGLIPTDYVVKIKNEDCYRDIKNKQPCEAEVENNIAVIIKIN